MIQLAKILAGLVLDHFKSKREEKRAVHERRMTQIENDQQIDLVNTQNARYSWRADYWTLILSIPAILAFFPNAVPAVNDGFAALESMPGWYRAALLSAVGAAFGYRAILEYAERKKK